jgi:hypothetical protein
MSHSGSFGVNYKRVWDGTTVPLPAQLTDIGSSPEGQFVFVQASGAIAQYAFVKIDSVGQASEATDAAIAGPIQIGVAQVAAADNEYLWVWIGGTMGGGLGVGIRGKVLTGYIAGSALFSTATAGAADDTSGTDKFHGVYGLAGTTGTQAIELASNGSIAVE